MRDPGRFLLFSGLPFVLLALARVSAGEAQEPADPATGEATALLAGTVVAAGSGEPLAEALVVLPALGIGTPTDSTGFFAFEGLEPGVRAVEVRDLGRRSGRVEAELAAGQLTRLELALGVEAVEVPGLEVTVRGRKRWRGKLAGFHERRKRGIGQFITREVIERREGQRFSEVFRKALGYRVVPCGSGGACYRLESRRGAPSFTSPRATSIGCRPVYFLDGVRWQPGALGLNDLSLDEVEAVEIYSGPATLPAQYRGSDTACGVVLIWTRAPEEGT